MGLSEWMVHVCVGGGELVDDVCECVGGWVGGWNDVCGSNCRTILLFLHHLCLTVIIVLFCSAQFPSPRRFLRERINGSPSKKNRTCGNGDICTERGGGGSRCNRPCSKYAQANNASLKTDPEIPKVIYASSRLVVLLVKGEYETTPLPITPSKPKPR